MHFKNLFLLTQLFTKLRVIILHFLSVKLRHATQIQLWSPPRYFLSVLLIQIRTIESMNTSQLYQMHHFNLFKLPTNRDHIQPDFCVQLSCNKTSWMLRTMFWCNHCSCRVEFNPSQAKKEILGEWSNYWMIEVNGKGPPVLLHIIISRK